MAAAGLIDTFVLPAHLEAAEPPEARGLKRDEVRLLAISDAARAEERYSPARYRSEIMEQLRLLAPAALS